MNGGEVVWGELGLGEEDGAETADCRDRGLKRWIICDYCSWHHWSATMQRSRKLVTLSLFKSDGRTVLRYG